MKQMTFSFAMLIFIVLGFGNLAAQDNCQGKEDKNLFIDCSNKPPKPVCGCDGKTYVNECLAKASGIKSFTPGICNGSDGCLAVKSPVLKDVCRNLPEAPVCGCDGVTYKNQCIAISAGVLKFTQGPCDKSNDDSSDIQPSNDCFVRPSNNFCPAKVDIVCGCDGKEYKNECFALNAGVKRFIKGPCNAQPTDDKCFTKPKKTPCPKDLKPVCGCDGKTYNNSCQALNAGVKEFTNGPCKNNNPGNTIPTRPTPDGCGVIHEHLLTEEWDANSQPACKITLDFYSCPNGEKTIVDADKRSDGINLTKEQILDTEAKCNGEDFCFKGKVSKTGLKEEVIKEFAAFDDVKIKVNEDGNFDVRTPKDRFLCGGIFGPSNGRSEVWGKCTINNKEYCVRMKWVQGTIDIRRNFTAR